MLKLKVLLSAALDVAPFLGLELVEFRPLGADVSFVVGI